MGHEPDLMPNWTLVIQLVIFLLSYAVMRSFVFAPYLTLLHKRQEKTTGLKERAAKDRERAESLRAQYEGFIRDERKKLNAWVDDERKKIMEEEHKIVQHAREQAGDELKLVKQSLHDECEKARKDLLPLVSDFSSQIASKLLGHKVKISSVVSEQGGKSKVEPSVLG